MGRDLSRYRFWLDPLFLTGCIAYAMNRWGIQPRVAPGFFHNHFNDLWLIPCALPPVLWIQQRLGLRPDFRHPQSGEVLFHVVLWSFLFEIVGPRLAPHTTADPLDVLAYGIGGLAATVWWQHRYTPPSRIAS